MIWQDWLILAFTVSMWLFFARELRKKVGTMKVIYLAGPITGCESLEHFWAAWRTLSGAGYAVINPAFPELIDNALSYNDFMKIDFALIAKCDALCLLASSPGADKEVAHAEGLGVPVLTMGDLVDVERSKIHGENL